MSKLVANNPFPYAGLSLKRGDVFETVGDSAAEDERVLKMVGLASEAGPVTSSGAGYHTTAMKSDELSLSEDGEYPAQKRRGRPPKDSGFYNRTDMRPED